MAMPRKGLGRVLVTLLLVVGFVIGPAAGRHAATAAMAGGCHGAAAAVSAAHGHAEGHGHEAAAPATRSAPFPDGFDLSRVPAGLACLVHCSLLPATAELGLPDALSPVIEPDRPSADPVSLEVEPAVPPPRFGEAT